MKQIAFVMIVIVSLLNISVGEAQADRGCSATVECGTLCLFGSDATGTSHNTKCRWLINRTVDVNGTCPSIWPNLFCFDKCEPTSDTWALASRLCKERYQNVAERVCQDNGKKTFGTNVSPLKVDTSWFDRRWDSEGCRRGD